MHFGWKSIIKRTGSRPLCLKIIYRKKPRVTTVALIVLICRFVKIKSNLSGGTFAPKFYSKYCEIDMTSTDYLKFIKLIEESYEMDTNRNTQPVSHNQEYKKQ